MAEEEVEIDESEIDETTLEFPNGRFVTHPYPLRRFFGLYWGDALRFDRHWLDASFGLNLCVPPNVMAIVLLANGSRQVLKPGRYSIRNICHVQVNGKWHEYAPVSVQFVTTRIRSRELSFPFTALNVKYRDEKEKEKNLTIEVQLALQVVDPLKVAELEEPLNDVKGALKQELIKALIEKPYDRLYQEREAIKGVIQANLNAIFEAHHGLKVVDILNIQLDPADASYIDLAQRGSLVDRNSEVRRREAQMEEDIFALEQPYVMRMAQTKINALMGERDFEARKMAVSAVQQLAAAISDDLHNHPGRWSPEESESLKQALGLLDKFGSRTPPITFAPLRSLYSKENYPPPGQPPVVVAGAEPAGTVDTSTKPPTVPAPEAVERATRLMAPMPPPPATPRTPEQKVAELDRLIELTKQLATLPPENAAPLRDAIKKLVDGL
jgi:hypothetical protein